MNTELLISKVFQKPEIWDTRVSAHCERVIVDKSWQEIANEMGLSDIEIRRKWKYLRDQFCVEIGKAKLRHEHGLEAQKPTWPHYEKMLFLKDVARPRVNNRVRSIIANTVNGDRSIKSTHEDDHHQAMDSNDDEHSQISSEANVQVIQQVVDTNEGDQTQPGFRIYQIGSVQSGVNDASVLQRKRTHEESEQGNEDANDSLKAGVQVFEAVLQPENSDLLFFKSLLPYVNMIPAHLKLRFRNRVQEVVEEFLSQSE